MLPNFNKMFFKVFVTCCEHLEVSTIFHEKKVCVSGMNSTEYSVCSLSSVCLTKN